MGGGGGVELVRWGCNLKWTGSGIKGYLKKPGWGSNSDGRPLGYLLRFGQWVWHD